MSERHAHRSERIKLDPKEARCVPHQPCTRKTACARYMAPIPNRYAVIMDGTVRPTT